MMEWPLEIIDKKFVRTSDALTFLGLDKNYYIKKQGPQYIADKLSCSYLTSLFSKGKCSWASEHYLMSGEAFLCLLFGGLPNLTRSKPSSHMSELRKRIMSKLFEDDVLAAKVGNNSHQTQVNTQTVPPKSQADEPIIVNMEPGQIQVLCYAGDVTHESHQETDKGLQHTSSEANVENEEMTNEPSTSGTDRTSLEEQDGAKGVTYRIEESGSQLRMPRLLDSQGYSYNIKHKSSRQIKWQCSIRPSVDPCKASVLQRDGKFISADVPHNHDPRTRYELVLLKLDEGGLRTNYQGEESGNGQSDLTGESVNKEGANFDTSLITCHIENDGHDGKNSRLIDSFGYTYKIFQKRQYPYCAVRWQCSNSSNETPCKATLSDSNGRLRYGKNWHNHQPCQMALKSHEDIRANATSATVVRPSTQNEESLPGVSSKKRKQFDVFPERAFYVPEDGSPSKKPTHEPNSSIIAPTVFEPPGVTFCVEEEGDGTKRTDRRVADSQGYQYNIKCNSEKGTYWECTSRPEENPCTALLLETNGRFAFVHQTHNHGAHSHSSGEITSNVTFQIEERGVSKKHIGLTDSEGYKYNIKHKSSNGTYWQCTSRGKVGPCKAAVVEKDGEYTFVNSHHNHQAIRRMELKLVTSEDQLVVDNSNKELTEACNMEGEECDLSGDGRANGDEPESGDQHSRCYIKNIGKTSNRTILLDSQGYSYKKSTRRPHKTVWVCTTRPEENRCKGSIIQSEGKFWYGKTWHNHTPTPIPASLGRPHEVENITKEPILPITIDKSSFVSWQQSTSSRQKPSEEIEVSCQLSEVSTSRQREKLIDEDGYCYSVKKRNKNGTCLWQCTTRPKGNRCRATMSQKDGKFLLGQHSHNHTGKLGLYRPGVTYNVEERARRGKTRMTDSLGYSYGVITRRAYGILWQCSRRLDQDNPCNATVIEKDDFFRFGRNVHNHPPQENGQGDESEDDEPQDQESNLSEDEDLESEDESGQLVGKAETVKNLQTSQVVDISNNVEFDQSMQEMTFIPGTYQQAVKDRPSISEDEAILANVVHQLGVASVEEV